jgi:chitinase
MKLFLLAAIGLSAVARAQLGAPANSDTPRRAAEAFLAGGSISTRSAPASATTQDAAAIKAAVLAGKYTSRLNEATRKRCPLSCSSTGANSSHWFAYQSVDRLDICNETMLVDFSLLSELNNPHSSNKIFACTADFGGIAGTEPATAATCHVGGVNYTENTLPLQMVSSGVSSSVGLTFVSDALTQLRKTFKLAGPSCNETIRYAYSEKAAIGIYIGSRLNNQDVIDSVLDQLTTTLQDNGAVSESLAVQLCDNRSARYSLGVFISTLPSLSAAQNAVQTWKNGSCLASMSTTSPAWHNITFNAPEVSHSHKNSSSLLNRAAHSSQLSARATCRTIQVQGGDSCSSLATECGITTAQFAEYNPASNDCSKYPVGENVCCSSGSLPDYLPKLDSQGNCLSHTIAAGDLCSTLAASLNITTDDIEEWNKDTWGWEGCNKLFIGDLMCLSAGYPPMPAPIANAVCGPQVNNTATAPPGTDLTQLNECPLNACCNIWGQCGTTADFCTVSNSSTGAPGTAAPGVNGCISNCGTDIISSSAPSEQFKIAYWEGFNWQRPCLNAGLQHLNTSAYTHVHFGFAGINPDWTINMSTIDPEFPFFQDLRGVKKILSFGGWAFSTDPSTYMIFRNAVASESSRSALVSNIVNFVNDNDLDGVDIDWEYPDEPDIPGIPAGTDDDSTGLFLLLDELKQSFALLAFGKTISITAPASYWYLQHFPIMALSTVVDYIVYMTYDLHGQWDYGRAYSDTGCPAGDCLRSHVNMTETVNALSMITKAGVASNKVVVGVSSYARSFGMITPGCWTEMCPYMGPDSGALAGPCTNTAGYLANYELNLVITENPTAEQYWDQDSYSNILVYNNTQWAAYMNDTNKQTREVIYGALSFLGSSDWAVDLQVEFGSDSGSSSSGSSGSGDNIVYIDPGIWSSASAEITALPGVTLIWPPKPLATPTTITFPPWTTTVSYSYLTTLTSTLSNGATSTYPWYYYVPIPTVITIPPGENWPVSDVKQLSM